MTSQEGYQAIAANILSNMQRSQNNQTMKFGQNITKETFFFRNHAENAAGRLVQNLVFTRLIQVSVT